MPLVLSAARGETAEVLLETLSATVGEQPVQPVAPPKLPIWEGEATSVRELVKPRRLRPLDPRPILAVCMMDEQACYEGELLSLSDTVGALAELRGKWTSRRLPQIPPALVVTDDPGALIGMLHRRFSRHQEPNSLLWQYRVSLRSSSMWLGRHASPYTALSPHLSMFGWAAQRGKTDDPNCIRRAHGRSRYYLVLDAFGWPTAADILEGYPGLLVEQMFRFATDLQAFCSEQQLPLGVSPAAIAGALLRDPRFWPTPRRKVPTATNARARKALPGNFYRLVLPRPASQDGEPLRLRGEVLELDQNTAHHAAAMRIRPPHTDTLYAWGRFYAPPPPPSQDLDGLELVDLDRIRSEHGLLLCAVESHGARMDPLSHPVVNHNGIRWRYLWTPEVPLVQSIPGAQVLGALAGWTSNQIDEGLCEYAWWAQEHLLHSDASRRRWLKPALLAAYGLLAAKPRPFMNLFRWAHGEQLAVTFPSGHTLHGYRTETDLGEPATANVIWRGMIEAQVRAESLRYARTLRTQGWRVVSIYADAIYVLAHDNSDDTPSLPAGWRLSQRLHSVQFLSPTHFTSDEIDKLPGIPHKHRRSAA
jgi:hypothetical protein